MDVSFGCSVIAQCDTGLGPKARHEPSFWKTQGARPTNSRGARRAERAALAAAGAGANTDADADADADAAVSRWSCRYFCLHARFSVASVVHVCLRDCCRTATSSQALGSLATEMNSQARGCRPRDGADWTEV